MRSTRAAREVPGAHHAPPRPRRRSEPGGRGAGDPRGRDAHRQDPLGGGQAPRARAHLQPCAPASSSSSWCRASTWETLLATEGVDAQPQFVVRELDAVQALAQLFLEVPPDTWRPYFKYHYLVSMAPVLPQAFDEEVFDFYGRTLKGQQQQRPRSKRAVMALDADLGEAVGRAVRRALLSGLLQGAGAGAGGESARFLRAAHRAAYLDDAGDQEGGAGEARRVPSQAWLSGHVARLLPPSRSSRATPSATTYARACSSGSARWCG